MTFFYSILISNIDKPAKNDIVCTNSLEKEVGKCFVTLVGVGAGAGEIAADAVAVVFGANAFKWDACFYSQASQLFMYIATGQSQKGVQAILIRKGLSIW